jgi:hypothetical protein
MDSYEFDRLAISLAKGPVSRRSIFAGGAAVAALLFPASDIAAKKKHCKKKKRCGKGCCNASSCFAKTVDANDGEPLSFGCCPAETFCKSELPNWRDQCCYPDETCDPLLPNRDIFADSICCRPCAGKCCQTSFECVDDVCTPANTARLPRYRR